MTINANAMRSIALGNNVFRNIAFALANCEEELCGAISSNSPISRALPILSVDERHGC